MSSENTKFDLERVRRLQNISKQSIENCPISKETLEAIYYDYLNYLPELEKLRIEILGVLTEYLPGKVHSIRTRVKEADHLIGKIIRGSYKNAGKYELLKEDNYRKVVTDLIGARIIILDRRDWREVHQALLTIFPNDPAKYIYRNSDILTKYDRYADLVKQSDTVPGCAYQAERPVGYITTAEDRKLYKDDSLRLDTSKAHYRSLHYIIRYKDVYVEIQMRSLFEEGWLEFDHRMKYPNDQYNSRKAEYISVLSNLANAADQLISYYEEEDFVKYSVPEHEVGDDTMQRKLPPETEDLETQMKHFF